VRVAAVGGVGIAVLVLGTFLPWLRSGRATRNSYEAIGAVRRLVHPAGVLDELFRSWPLLGAVCALAVAVHVLGLRVLGSAIGVLASLAGGAGAVAALAARDNAYASVIETGPAVTIAGAAIVLISVGVDLATRERRRRVREEPS
jgi:hypothetical protein